MKKITFLLLFGLLAGICTAQSDEEKDGFNLPNGIRLGFQSSDLLGDGIDTHGTMDRGYIGYLRKMTIAHFIKIETGLEYMIAGAELTEDSELQLHYLCIPAQGLFKLGPFVAQAGLSGNIKVSETYKLNGDKVDRPDDDKASGFDVAANFGAGFNIAFLTIEARHYWGLLEVDESVFNDYWQLGLKGNF